MRSTNMIQLAAAAALALVPAVAGAVPLRAGAALPKRSIADSGAAQRAATPMKGRSDLRGLPVLGFVGLFVIVGLIVVVASSGGGRSPG